MIETVITIVGQGDHKLFEFCLSDRTSVSQFNYMLSRVYRADRTACDSDNYWVHAD